MRFTLGLTIGLLILASNGAGATGAKAESERDLALMVLAAAVGLFTLVELVKLGLTSTALGEFRPEEGCCLSKSTGACNAIKKFQTMNSNIEVHGDRRKKKLLSNDAI